MLSSFHHETIARWFFLIVAAGVFYLFWQILEPFAIVLLTAGIVAVVTTPVEKYLRKIVKHAWLSSLIVAVLVFLIIVGPLTAAAVVMTQQAIDIANSTLANPDWVKNFKLEELPAFLILPAFVREYLLGLDIPTVLGSIADWASTNAGSFLTGGVAFVFKASIFFICLFFLLFERERIMNEIVDLSPFKDSVDRNIILRMVETVRGVVFGSLIVAVVQGIVAGIGFTIFGVPGALIWAAVVIVASQVPIIGTSAVTIPAVLYLLLTGNIVGGVGLAIWAMLAVGLVDNLLAPFIVGGRTRMHALLILLSVLGGIEYFGPIGFILGPTVLAAFLVVLELYKAGILEKKNVA